jgi:vacuolar-type H+-ATPase subunit C/Vma6
MRNETGLVARARALVGHLVPRPTLESLAEAVDLPAFARAVARLGSDLEPVSDPWDLPAFERAVRQTGARHLATLRRWQRGVSEPLEIVSGDVDRKSVRRMIRGAMQGAPAAVRLEGLSATPQLPERVLTELARQPSPTAVVGLLAAMRHPDADALAPLVARAQPELYAIDRVLLSGWARRAERLARRDPAVRDLVRLRIDTANIQTALLLAQGPRDVAPSTAFVDGGEWLPLEAFVTAAEARRPAEALVQLQQTLAETPLATLLPAVASDVDAMERKFLTQTLEALARRARLDPLGTPTLLRTLLAIEAQGRDLRTLAWGAALGTPPASRKALLVTPWA